MVKLKDRYEWGCTDFHSNNPSCSSGDFMEVWIVDTLTGNIVWEGTTCPCQRGCNNRDCIRDDWNDGDTDVEPFRSYVPEF